MSILDENNINLYDFGGFPDRQLRDDAEREFKLSCLYLKPVENPSLYNNDLFLEVYNTWSNQINNYKSRLATHCLLMYYHYRQNALDIFDASQLQSPQYMHKIFFDMFAEDTTLYLISYFDKHLEMFRELYCLNPFQKRKIPPGRGKILEKMEKNNVLVEISGKYRNVEKSEAFKEILKIRKQFVHNQSLSYPGISVEKALLCSKCYAPNPDYEFHCAKCGEKFDMENNLFQYNEGNKKGLSTKFTLAHIETLLTAYGGLCDEVNQFFKNLLDLNATR